MRFLADECCDAGLIAGLRADGHDVLAVVDVLRGATDDVVLERAASEDRILLTEDKDFGDLTLRLGKPAVGIVLIRIDPAEHSLKEERVRILVERFGNRLAGQYCVISEDRFRFRSLRY